ncbi:SNARE associated Golgi protein, partial [Haemophilus influenzae]
FPFCYHRICFTFSAFLASGKISRMGR